jgi:hypothetical protein
MMQQHSSFKQFVFLLSIALLPSSLPAMNGWEIAKKVELAREGYGDAVTSLKLVMINSSGEKRTRKILFKQTEKALNPDGSVCEASMMIISPSRCSKSIAILTKENKSMQAKQWMFLPALQKVRSISSATSSGTLAGSEFSYEDLSSQSMAHYRYSDTAEIIDYNGKKAWQFERYPQNGQSLYGKQVLIADSVNYCLYRIDFYDPKGALFKTLTLEGYHAVNGLQRFKAVKMVNHKNKNISIMQVLSEQLNIGLSSEAFDQNVLRDKIKRIKCYFQKY